MSAKKELQTDTQAVYEQAKAERDRLTAMARESYESGVPAAVTLLAEIIQAILPDAETVDAVNEPREEGVELTVWVNGEPYELSADKVSEAMAAGQLENESCEMYEELVEYLFSRSLPCEFTANLVTKDVRMTSWVGPWEM